MHPEHPHQDPAQAREEEASRAEAAPAREAIHLYVLHRGSSSLMYRVRQT